MFWMLSFISNCLSCSWNYVNWKKIYERFVTLGHGRGGGKNVVVVCGAGSSGGGAQYLGTHDGWTWTMCSYVVLSWCNMHYSWTCFCINDINIYVVIKQFYGWLTLSFLCKVQNSFAWVCARHLLLVALAMVWVLVLARPGVLLVTAQH